jgi:hypothetical protein
MKSPVFFLRIQSFLCLFFFAQAGFAQFGYTEIKYFEGFETAKLAIVRTGDKQMDDAMESAFKKYWKVNEFFLIESKDITQHTKKKDVYFISMIELTHMTTVGYKVIKMCLIDDFIYKRNGEVDFDEMDIIATAQFQKLDDVELANLEAEMTKSVQFLNNHCNFVLTEKSKKHYPIKEYLKILSARNKNEVRSKTLLLTTDILPKDMNDEARVKEYYKNPFSIVSQNEQYQSIIQQNEDDVYILFYMDYNLTFKCIATSKDSRILFGEVTTGFNQNTLKPAYLKMLNSLNEK